MSRSVIVVLVVSLVLKKLQGNVHSPITLSFPWPFQKLGNTVTSFPSLVVVNPKSDIGVSTLHVCCWLTITGRIVIVTEFVDRRPCFGGRVNARWMARPIW